jgi:hypothetical protein
MLIMHWLVNDEGELSIQWRETLAALENPAARLQPEACPATRESAPQSYLQRGEPGLHGGSYPGAQALIGRDLSARSGSGQDRSESPLRSRIEETVASERKKSVRNDARSGRGPSRMGGISSWITRKTGRV